MRVEFGAVAKVCGVAAMASAYCAGAADARPAPRSPSDLSAALNELAKDWRIELIYDPAQVAGAKGSVPLAASAKAALDLLLADTAFTYRQPAPKTFVIVARSVRPSTASVDTQAPSPSAGPEIIVVGRRSQNIDLVRGKDEIQPYWIASGEDIAAAGAPTLDAYFRNQLSLNRDVSALSQRSASPRSELNLRGLGTDQTLVLVDGRRFASVPASAYLVTQSDVNAIPPEAVARIEVLATSAGGIFGIGATGGVVNIVLKRDYDGILVSAENGTTTRGDGVEHRVYGRLGWSSPSGRTNVMVSGSYAHDDGILAGERSYQQQARALRVGSVGYDDIVLSNALNIRSLTGEPLSFNAANGGATLAGSITYLPLGAGALDAAGRATLAANAGKQDISLSQDGQGAFASLIAQTRRISVITTLRQELGASSTVFIDYLRFDDRGYESAAGFLTGYQDIAPGAAGNPFNQAIVVSFPNGIPAGVVPEYDVSDRVSVGLIRRFAGGWTLETDGAYSATSLSSGYFAAGLLTSPRLFDGSAALAADLQNLYVTVSTDSSTNHLADFNLRLTGPFATLPGGPATLTATGEFRREWSQGTTTDLASVGAGAHYHFSTTASPHAENVWSAFGETRLPILPQSGSFRPWRGLAAQLAVRLDHYSLSVPAETTPDVLRDSGAVLGLTAGLQSRPLDGVMLRASYSTSAVPPLPYLLTGVTYTTTADDLIDPKRGGIASSGNDTLQVTTKNSALGLQKTDSLSAGLVVEPVLAPGLRLSVDYTRLKTRGVIETFASGDLQYILDNESLYPGRVQRAALTGADRALGYTAGRIVALDDSPLQVGTSNLQTLDGSLSYDLPAGAGRLHLEADGDWTLSYRQVSDPSVGAYQLAGYADGPLAWRANAALEWSTARWSVGTRAALYASYWLRDAAPLQASAILSQSLSAAQIAAYQLSEPHVPTQAYFDASFAFRPQGRRGMQIRATVANLFDKTAPVVASVIPTGASSYVDVTTPTGVANYGDALGRRIALNVTLPVRF